MDSAYYKMRSAANAGPSLAKMALATGPITQVMIACYAIAVLYLAAMTWTGNGLPGEVASASYAVYTLFALLAVWLVFAIVANAAQRGMLHMGRFLVLLILMLSTLIMTALAQQSSGPASETAYRMAELGFSCGGALLVAAWIGTSK
jgi:hypothetical protein